MKILERILEFFDEVWRRLPPIIDPFLTRAWLLWIILPLLLSLMGLM